MNLYNARDDHQQSVAYAQQEVTDLQALLGVAQEKADVAVGAIHQAVGLDAIGQVESARNALEHTAAVREKIPELISMLTVAIQELTRYGGGF